MYKFIKSDEDSNIEHTINTVDRDQLFDSFIEFLSGCGFYVDDLRKDHSDILDNLSKALRESGINDEHIRSIKNRLGL